MIKIDITSEELKANVKIMTENVGNLYTDTIIASIIVKARDVKDNNQSLIIGLDTGWIPAFELGNWQHKAINGLLKELVILKIH